VTIEKSCQIDTDCPGVCEDGTTPCDEDSPDCDGIVGGTCNLSAGETCEVVCWIVPGGVDCQAPHYEDGGDGYGYAEITTSEPPPPVPTLTEWGMISFMTIMMGTGVMILRKRRRVYGLSEA
jgi:hypothetical protein